MKAKQFFKGLSWLLALNLAIKPAWIFAVDRPVQNLVGHEAYGTYFALFNLTYVLFFIADAGLSNMLTQRLAATEKVSIRQLLRLKLFLLLLYAGVCAAVALFTGVTQWRLLGYLVLIQSFASLFLFLRSVLAARQLFKTDAFFSVLDKSLLLLLCLGPVYGSLQTITIELFLQLQVFSSSVAVSTLFLLLAKRNLLTAGRGVAVKTIATWVAPFVLILLLMSAHNRLDAFLLERLHHAGAVQAGIYAAAYRLLDAANMVGYLTASFLVPFLSRHRHEKPLLQQVILFSRHGLLICAAGVVAFVSVFAPWLQQVLYHSSAAQTNTVLRLCLAALPAYYLTHVYGSALTATAHFRLFIRVVFVAVVANVLLNMWLIPLYGATGCCLAALVTQYGCGLVLWVAASRRLSVAHSAGDAVFYLAALVVSGIVFYCVQKLTGSVWIILSSIVPLVFVVMVTQRSAVKKFLLPFYK